METKSVQENSAGKFATRVASASNILQLRDKSERDLMVKAFASDANMDFDKLAALISNHRARTSK